MSENWNQANGLPKADLEKIKRAGGPKVHNDDAHIFWYKNVARKLYPHLIHDDPRDEATFLRDY